MWIQLLILQLLVHLSIQNDIQIYGPGLQPTTVVMPARYFFINFININENTYSPDLPKLLAVEITGKSSYKGKCRIWVNKLDRRDGSFIVRYKVYETCYDLSISIYFKNEHVKGSPKLFKGPVHADQCDCPDEDFNGWLKKYGCTEINKQIKKDLEPYHNVNMLLSVKKIITKYHKPDSISFCHYVIKDNKLFRTCYGKHVGFNMFADNMFLFLSRKVKLPDMDMVVNLGDWPLVKVGTEPLPVFSWCGSNDTIDIVMPTYDITESTLENMGRVSLDILSVQGNVERPWNKRVGQAIWRGRDSRAERLKLVDIARANPDLFNVSLTNFFFFREKEAEYGPKQPHISFFKFFDYKYQVNVDGTVAAYRFPYLLAGGGMVLKQDSPYYEHFYSQTNPWEHYVPVKRDLSDLTERVRWALENDDKAKLISQNARNFANNNLLPQHIICYHAHLFSEWSKRINSPIKVRGGMTHVPQPKFECNCQRYKQSTHEEF